MSITKHLLLFCLLCPLFLSASTGPGRPVILDELWMDSILHDLEPVTVTDISESMTAADRASMNAMFAAAPAVSDRSDDIRKVAKLAGALKEQVDKARGILDKVRDPLRQVSNLVDAQLANLPLGIRKQFGNVEVFLAIGEARLKATYAEIDLYLGLDLPNTDQDPIFLAKGVKWSRKSGFIGDVEMRLIADWGINMQAGKSRLVLHKTIEGDTTRGCYAVVTCEGLQSAQIDGTVLLSRDWVVPVINGIPLSDPSNNAETSPFSNVRVNAHFRGAFDQDQGFFFETGFETPFAFKGKEDVHIAMQQVVLDYSSARNADMQFPEGYQSPFVDPVSGVADNRWQGLYVSGVSITLPEQFQKNGGEPIQIGAPQIIFDDTGVTAHLYAANIMPLGNKTVDQWAFSVDSVNLKVMHSNFEMASITGMVNVPMLGAKANCTEYVPPNAPIIDADCLTYRAMIRPDEYYFGVYLNRDYCIPVFKAGEVVIEENTKIELSYVNEELTAQAILYGSITIDARSPSGDASFTMDSLSFDSLILRTRAPYFSPGEWDFPKSITAKYKAFELGFRNIHMAKDSLNDNGGRNCQLYFNAYVSVDSELELDASGAFRMLGVLEDTDDGQKWKYRSIKLDAFSIRASTSSFTVGASLAFYGQDDPDPVWGSGFYGYGELILKALPAGSVGFGAVAQFGSKDDTKYFMIDVMGTFAGASIPVFPGLNLGAIGGGVYNNMTANQDFLSMDEDGGDRLAELTDQIEGERNAPEPTSALTGVIGRSLSGKQYTVSPGNLGFYVQLVLVAPNEESYSITGRLEMEINKTNGWKASITASAQAMNPPNYSGNLLIEKGVGIYVEVAIKKVANKVSFEAAAEVFINVDNGKIVGINTPMPPDTSERARFVSENGFAGGVYLKFSEDEWYFRVGTPTAPLGIRVPVAEAYAYFCVGDNVPPIPPLPDNVTAIVGDMDMSRDMASIENASGFAFGAGLEIGSEGSFLIFRYNFNAGIGFDINIRNYGDAVCADDQNGPSIGVNGWYAAGQAWAYISGELKVLGKNVASAGLAAVLQVRGPKPTMARGVLAGYYQIGRGRKKTFRLQAQFGDGCTIVGRGGESPFADLDVLSGSSIRDGATEVKTSVTPEVFAILPMQERIAFSESVTYRVEVVTNRLVLVGDSDEPVDHDEVNLSGNYGLYVTPEDYLLPNTNYRYEVEILIEKLAGGSWSDEKTETKVISFTTGDASTMLDTTNITDTYPYDGMVNFYSQEYDEGVVTLDRKQPALMTGLTAVWTRAGGGETRSEVTVWQNQIRFDIPTTLANDQVYELALVQEQQSPVMDGTGQGSNQNFPHQNDFGGMGGGESVTNNFSLSETWQPLLVEERVIYRSYIRTSRFNTFEEKVASMTGNVIDGSGDSAPRQVIRDQEGWGLDEIYEVEGGDDPLVTISISSTNSYPEAYLRTNILSRFDPVYLNGNVSLGVNSSGQQQFASFDDVTLVYPGEKESIYFNVTDSVAAFNASISQQDFDQNEYRADISGQEFVFSFSKTIATNLSRFKESVEDIPDRVFDLLVNTATNNSSPPICVECMTGSSSNLLSAFSNPMAMSQMSTQSPYNILRNYWSDKPDNSAEMSQCQFKRPVRMALRDMSTLLSLRGYKNTLVAVKFYYNPPGKSPHSVTRNITVK